MPQVYPYCFTSDGDGPWWGIRCPKAFYQNMVVQLTGATRCFVVMTNTRGDKVVVAVEGPHYEDSCMDDVFAPPWVLERLNIEAGDQVFMTSISHGLPRGERVTLRPLTGATVAGPMFLEGFAEALNQLGVIQEGLLSAVVDPSTGLVHQFMIESLAPACICLADGELHVDFERSLDRTPTPPPSPVLEPTPDTAPAEHAPGEDSIPSRGFVAFSGRGHRF
jgi:hypothetical protein